MKLKCGSPGNLFTVDTNQVFTVALRVCLTFFRYVVGRHRHTRLTHDDSVGAGITLQENCAELFARPLDTLTQIKVSGLAVAKLSLAVRASQEANKREGKRAV